MTISQRVFDLAKQQGKTQERARQCLNTDEVYYIFVNGVAGIVIMRKDNR